MPKFKGLATGIGSMPQKEAAEAVDLIFKYLPEIPFWPQLPKLDKREGMLTQFAQNLACLRPSEEGVIFLDKNREDELEKFYERIISNDLEYFKISPDYAQGLYKFYDKLSRDSLEKIEYIKCQLVGPFTFAASIRDSKDKSLLHDSVLMQAVLKGLAMKGLWQVNLFKKFGKKIIIFFDEPYLGCFGSAYTAVNRNDVVNTLSEFSQAFKSSGAYVGVHCCGNTDWSIFTDINTIDIINFDASSFLERFVLYAEDLGKFLKREGTICWGIVPTQNLSEKQSPQSIIEKLKKGIDALISKGLDPVLIREHLLLSPACGLGSLSVRESEQILKLLSEASKLAEKNF